MSNVKQTFCRICEPVCPMQAEVNDKGQAVKLMPNPDHPLSSNPCHKGLSFLDVHNDPDRLNWPLRRTNLRSAIKGEFERVEWDVALREAGQRVQSIREEFGNNAVAVYVGNPPVFNSRGSLLAYPLAGMLGTGMSFGSGTQDCMNKTATAAAMYGSVFFSTPDVYHTDYLLCIGGNPKISHWTGTSVPNDAGEALKAIKNRGGKVCFVNPRKIESSTLETGDTLLIKPDTDVYFLAAVLNEIHSQGGFDEAFLSEHAKHLSEVLEFTSRYPADRVAGITGISANDIRAVAADITAAKSAVSYISTGAGQGRQGTLCYLLSEMIAVATGNFGRQGGAFRPAGFMDTMPPLPPSLPIQTSLGEISPSYGYDNLPISYLSELIESGEIRALINVGGNPLITTPGESRLNTALEKLDVMVTIDILHNEMADLSDYVLPACDWLEREDINLVSVGMQQIPYVQYTDKVEEPAEQRRNDWWILSRLLQEIGIPSPLDDPEHREGKKQLDQMLAMKGLSLQQLKDTPHLMAFLEPGQRDSIFEICLNHEDSKIDCFPPMLVQAGLLERCENIFTELANEPADTLKLISLRTNYMHNSWLINVAKLRRGMQSINPLNMCSDDAERLGLFDGEPICVFNQYGEIETQLLVNNDLRPGAVAMTHGYGRGKGVNMLIASSKPGANYNQLLPMLGDDYAYEPFSAMSWMCGVPVSVKRIS